MDREQWDNLEQRALHRAERNHRHNCQRDRYQRGGPDKTFSIHDYSEPAGFGKRSGFSNFIEPDRGWKPAIFGDGTEHVEYGSDLERDWGNDYERGHVYSPERKLFHDSNGDCHQRGRLDKVGALFRNGEPASQREHCDLAQFNQPGVSGNTAIYSHGEQYLEHIGQLVGERGNNFEQRIVYRAERDVIGECDSNRHQCGGPNQAGAGNDFNQSQPAGTNATSASAVAFGWSGQYVLRERKRCELRRKRHGRCAAAGLHQYCNGQHAVSG